MIRDLLRRCVLNEPEAWGEMWLIFEETARPAVRRNLGHFARDPHTVDDAIQDFYIHLTRDGLRNLLTFQGNSRSQFNAFLRAAARNFAWNWSQHRRCLARTDEQSRRNAPIPDRSGPTEAQVKDAVDHLATQLTPNEIKTMKELAGVEDVPAGEATREVAHPCDCQSKAHVYRVRKRLRLKCRRLLDEYP